MKPETREKLRAAWTPERRAQARAQASAYWTPERRQQARTASLEHWTAERREQARRAAQAAYDATGLPSRADLVYDGATFGKLTVLVQRLRPPYRALGSPDVALLSCSCGELVIVAVSQLTRSDRPTLSCGCKGIAASRRAIARAEGRLAYQLREQAAKTIRASEVARALGVTWPDDR